MMRSVDPRRAALAVLILALAACGPREDFDYVSADEIPPGPGLFTGASGEYEVLSIGAGGAAQDGPESSASTSGKDPNALPEGLPPDRQHRPEATE